MIPRDDHHGYPFIHHSENLSYGEIDDSVGGPYRVKEITGMQHKIGLKLDYLIHGGCEGAADVLFPLIESGG
jgi:hypothetical protein